MKQYTTKAVIAAMLLGICVRVYTGYRIRADLSKTTFQHLENSGGKVRKIYVLYKLYYCSDTNKMRNIVLDKIIFDSKEEATEYAKKLQQPDFGYFIQEYIASDEGEIRRGE